MSPAHHIHNGKVKMIPAECEKSVWKTRRKRFSLVRWFEEVFKTVTIITYMQQKAAVLILLVFPHELWRRRTSLIKGRKCYLICRLNSVFKNYFCLAVLWEALNTPIISIEPAIDSLESYFLYMFSPLMHAKSHSEPFSEKKMFVNARNSCVTYWIPLVETTLFDSWLLNHCKDTFRVPLISKVFGDVRWHYQVLPGSWNYFFRASCECSSVKCRQSCAKLDTQAFQIMNPCS